MKQCVGRQGLYDALCQQELYAEQVEQGLLLANFHDYTRAATVGTTRTQLQRVCHNIATYFVATHVRFSARSQADCLLLVQALFPRVTPAVLTRTCHEVWSKSGKQRKPRQMLLSFPLYGH